MDEAQNPLVSIVLPTYNGAKYLRQSIESCLNQAYKNIELIIVDDCSIDETSEICQSFTQKDPRIRYIRNSQNLRLPASLNIGFKHSTGEYLTWTSDDNYYAREAIEVMMDYLLRNHGDFVYCDYYNIQEDNDSDFKRIKLPAKASFRYINPIRACFLYTRKVMEVTGDYDPTMELVEDYDYWIRVSKNFFMHHLDQPLYYYRDHSKSLYNTRFWEVEVVKLLVRIKYDITDEKECVYWLKETIVRKKGKFPFLNKIYAKVLLSRKIQLIFERFKKGELGFSEAKLQLCAVVNDVKKES